MYGFRGIHTNKLDAKGRVSIPARFRAVLEKDELNSVICYPSFKQDVVEAGGRRLMDELDGMLNRLDPYSDEREALSHALIGASEELLMDQDGRVTLPESLREIAHVTSSVTFVGLGNKFQFWQPEAYQDHYVQARAMARENRFLLRSLNKGSGDG
ncbi:MAG: hypothetical protein V6Z81_02995 [Parvularculales bacterium]